MLRTVANKHITEPDKHGYQVRIVRNKKEHSRFFSHSQWGSKVKSLQAAKSWRDQMLVSLGSVNKYLIDRPALENNTTTGVRGVTKSTRTERNGTLTLYYQVHWRKNNKPMNKTFNVGNVEKVTATDDLHTFRTAVKFRREYELFLAEGIPFVHERFIGWKRKPVYVV